jgi:hypothetical protein
MPDKFVYVNKDIQLANITIKKKTVGILINCEDKCQIQFINPNVLITLPNEDFIRFDPLLTGDDFTEKICNICHVLLPVDNFDKNQNAKNNRTVRRPSCKQCRITIDGKSMSSKERKMWNETKPHLELFECPVCQKRTIAGVTSKVVLDHDHSKGVGRGWICDSCNTGLGRFKDDPELLEHAMDYISKK